MLVWTIKEYTNVETSLFSFYKPPTLGHGFTSLRIHFLQKWAPRGEGWTVRQKRRQSSSNALTANLAAHQESNLATRPPNPTGACVLQVPQSITETSFFVCVSDTEREAKTMWERDTRTKKKKKKKCTDSGTLKKNLKRWKQGCFF